MKVLKTRQYKIAKTYRKNDIFWQKVQTIAKNHLASMAIIHGGIKQAITSFKKSPDKYSDKLIVEASKITEDIHLQDRLIKTAKQVLNNMNKYAGITWRTPSDYNPNFHEIIDVNIPKFDAAWSKTPFYVESISKMANPKKYEVWQKRYSEGFIGEMPSAMIGDSGYGEQEVGILDGRHRYSVSRDNGETTIPMMVPKDQADIFLKLFS